LFDRKMILEVFEKLDTKLAKLGVSGEIGSAFVPFH